MQGNRALSNSNPYSVAMNSESHSSKIESEGPERLSLSRLEQENKEFYLEEERRREELIEALAIHKAIEKEKKEEEAKLQKEKEQEIREECMANKLYDQKLLKMKFYEDYNVKLQQQENREFEIEKQRKKEEEIENEEKLVMETRLKRKLLEESVDPIFNKEYDELTAKEFARREQGFNKLLLEANNLLKHKNELICEVEEREYCIAEEEEELNSVLEQQREEQKELDYSLKIGDEKGGHEIEISNLLNEHKEALLKEFAELLQLVKLEANSLEYNNQNFVLLEEISLLLNNQKLDLSSFNATLEQYYAQEYEEHVSNLKQSTELVSSNSSNFLQSGRFFNENERGVALEYTNNEMIPQDDEYEILRDNLALILFVNCIPEEYRRLTLESEYPQELFERFETFDAAGLNIESPSFLVCDKNMKERYLSFGCSRSISLSVESAICSLQQEGLLENFENVREERYGLFEEKLEITGEQYKLNFELLALKYPEQKNKIINDALALLTRTMMKPKLTYNTIEECIEKLIDIQKIEPDRTISRERITEQLRREEGSYVQPSVTELEEQIEKYREEAVALKKQIQNIEGFYIPLDKKDFKTDSEYEKEVQMLKLVNAYYDIDGVGCTLLKSETLDRCIKPLAQYSCFQEAQLDELNMEYYYEEQAIENISFMLGITDKESKEGSISIELEEINQMIERLIEQYGNYSEEEKRVAHRMLLHEKREKMVIIKPIINLEQNFDPIIGNSNEQYEKVRYSKEPMDRNISQPKTITQLDRAIQRYICESRHRTSENTYFE